MTCGLDVRLLASRHSAPEVQVLALVDTAFLRVVTSSSSVIGSQSSSAVSSNWASQLASVVAEDLADVSFAGGRFEFGPHIRVAQVQRPHLVIVAALDDREDLADLVLICLAA